MTEGVSPENLKKLYEREEKTGLQREIESKMAEGFALGLMKRYQQETAKKANPLGVHPGRIALRMQANIGSAFYSVVKK